jgi:hypothetical protein
VVNYCTVPVKPRGDRSSLPGVNKQVSDIVLLVLRVLSFECALLPQDPKLVSELVSAAAAAISGQRGCEDIRPKWRPRNWTYEPEWDPCSHRR